MEFIIIAVAVLLDQVSKYWVQNNAVLLERTVIIPGFLNLTYVKNTGAAWSMLSGQQGFLILVSVIEIGALLWFLYQEHKKHRKVSCAALALMLGGALGNLIDRVMFGYVRDFIDTFIFGYNFPVFNIADSALTIGVVILIIHMIWEDRKEKENAA